MSTFSTVASPRIATRETRAKPEPARADVRVTSPQPQSGANVAEALSPKRLRCIDVLARSMASSASGF